MEKFNRAQRFADTKRLKAKRKDYYSVWIKTDPKQLGRVVNTACLCSCAGCSGSAYRKLVGNSNNGLKATHHSALQLLKTEQQ